MLCNISISTINNNISTFYKTNYNINLFYPFLDRLMEFNMDNDYLHDEFIVRLTENDLKSVNTSDLKKSDLDFINELKELSKNNQIIEIDGRFRRFINVEELN